MKVLIFDPQAGCAGDMIMGALVSAGVDFAALKTSLDGMSLTNYDLTMQETQRHHITGIKIDVNPGHEHAHRHLKDLNQIIDDSNLKDIVKDNAKKIFNNLAGAEAKVHNSSPDKIHFHEVGAIDAIVDIVGACIALDLLAPDKIYSRPIALGSGIIKAAHGKIPLPSPATSELVKNFPVIFRPLEHELTTPTGAAIITTLAEPLPAERQFKILAAGYGAGSRDSEEIANLLRVYIAETSKSYDTDSILKIETNIDNQNPEIYSYLFERLFELGVKDVYTAPIQMKKNRPGNLLTVLCNPEDKDRIVEFIFENSTTSGIRFQYMDRVKLKRSSEMIETSFGKIMVKVYHLEGKKRYYPEYDDLKKLAFEHKISIIDLNQKLQFEIRTIKEC